MSETTRCQPPLLRMTGISKSFPGVRALNSVDFEVGAAEIHAFLGENGAGKSTLLKILSGAQAARCRHIEFAGQPRFVRQPAGRADRRHRDHLSGVHPRARHDDRRERFHRPGARIAVFISRRKLEEETRGLTNRIGLDRNPRALVRDLSVAEQQMVEIARALSMKSRLIVMDEPTSALSRTEVEKLFAIIRALKRDGISTIFVTHRLEEVFEICDRYTVLRDGRHVGTGSVAGTTLDHIIRLMVGRELSLLAPRDTSYHDGRGGLAVEGISRRRKSSDASAIELHDVSLAVNKGEILGIAGLVGAGRTETARAIFGADAIDSGKIIVAGKAAAISSPRDAINQGIGLVPEDRKQQALFLALAIRTNLSIASHDRISSFGHLISAAKEEALVEEYRKLLNIRMASGDQLVGNLSGGNQQKVVLARWLALRPKVLIVDEPTRGIDVGAKVEVHNLLFQMAAVRDCESS